MNQAGMVGGSKERGGKEGGGRMKEERGKREEGRDEQTLASKPRAMACGSLFN